ncbi:hypothetical protein PHYBLDRAFT_61555 [Phycomyces blakesleeanus NRRL 1555(-)]|uniref:Uncharacterized protein n=1 Tax=Phycomyces blakesleeanus (strain ATCC 8743b / DSM 1359 / FGSC 10004 / NBRC 33097 / NRRL 1555) TaxID=763407 RepID=A0A167QZC9_PHYB8|nr:hypothetical protein PHYBLDRAFT_61555 [Phycomyces blakesleeanus NRRL 1555(-)]OAD80504.1 hypothetical protein PHYBLDRAFT_61555 [Phycomyces blakesleeanus NRRL 1555(-)]|eukprot:XP_018298544.1 hypothetical protein PHYBLDRAFT_61555 [Phycomyces blakesleeanus NRRL 1555(-)]
MSSLLGQDRLLSPNIEGLDLHVKHIPVKRYVFVTIMAGALFIVFMLIYPCTLILIHLEVHRFPTSINTQNTSLSFEDWSKKSIQCGFSEQIPIPESEEGSYTPPPPDATLYSALKYVSQEDQLSFCSQVNSHKGFVDGKLDDVKEDSCGTWMARYTALHEKRLEQLERLKAGDYESFSHEDRPRYVGYLCQVDKNNPRRGCGGLADRMSGRNLKQYLTLIGMVSTFFYALLTDRAYLAYWEPTNPVPLEDLFEKPSIDWSYNPNQLKELFTKENLLLSFSEVDMLNYNWKSIGNTLFPNGPSQNFHQLWNTSFVSMRSNRAYIIRTFQKSSIYPEWLAKVGLTKENAFRCMTDYLFRPTIGSRRFIKAYKNLFDMESVLSIGLQIRTDDRALANPESDDNTLEQWDYFFKCANDLRDAKKRDHHKTVVYFLITDSISLREQFISMNNNKILAKQVLGDGYKYTSLVTTGLPIEHMEPTVVIPKFSADAKSKLLKAKGHMLAGVNSAVIENWLLSATNYRLISRKGYGKMAAFHAKEARTTINLPEKDAYEKIYIYLPYPKFALYNILYDMTKSNMVQVYQHIHMEKNTLSRLINQGRPVSTLLSNVFFDCLYVHCFILNV